MKVTKTLTLPINVLLGYRQNNSHQNSNVKNVDDIAQQINFYGMDAVELSVVDDRALLTDGNYRIIAAQRLGLSEVPVVINTFSGEGREIFFEHALHNFKRITNELYCELKKVLAPDTVSL